MNKTPLHAKHVALNAKMTEFHGWEMPLYYSSILDEHQAVREAAGLFDVSHMGQVFVEGPNAVQTLNALFVSDVSQVAVGRACYTLMLNESGGIIDDLIIYRLAAERFLVIVNCARREVDVAWLTEHCTVKAAVKDRSAVRGLLALQGPKAAAVLEKVVGQSVSALGRFDLVEIKGYGADAWVARTGYTGSDGFEIFLDAAHVVDLWDKLLQAAQAENGKAIGLGARDTLRVEAGLRLYGSDMDETTTPLEAGLGWTVATSMPQFIGYERLVAQKEQGVERTFIGFWMDKGPVPREGMPLFADGKAVGTVTSGTFSPLLKKPLGMGYVQTAYARVGTTLEMEVRNQRYAVEVVKLPFWKVKNNQPVAQATK